MKNVTSEDVQPWLGGEAHVRRQADRRWRLPAHWRQGLWLSLAFLAGSTVTGGTAAVIARARGTPASRPREKEERSMRRHHHRLGYSTGDVLAVFLAGAVMGAGVALLAAPESGARMRRRLARGARTAQEELAGVVEGTREALEALTKDARQTLRHTAMRLTDAMEATKDALKSDADPLKGPAPNE
jgi:gas vesicle protein